MNRRARRHAQLALETWIVRDGPRFLGDPRLEQYGAKQDEVASANTELESTTQQSAEIIKDQERLRQNLGSLNRVAGQEALVQKYVKDLADQENTIAQLRDKTAQLRKRKIALESELSSLIDKLEF